ncbi:TPA: hypothetical protein JBF89_13295 [Legionella pneumophila]|nr:hypothetical protein [Legionella pneumophila]HAU0349940.1 hypothetical protein [Legionella pneumophila]HAU0353431.1 hypothetical protein [Legionella pneumophila]HAU0359520.1 hypothetical protein [Legionella pneumophila]HAU0368077.1 hypothetical protein [Legionella pneumophila]
MINLSMLYLLISLPFGSENAVTQHSAHVTKFGSQYCERLYIKNHKGKGAWRTVCIPHINLPDVQTKGCPALISLIEGRSGCLISYMRVHRNKDDNFLELLEYVHADEMDMRADHV